MNQVKKWILLMVLLFVSWWLCGAEIHDAATQAQEMFAVLEKGDIQTVKALIAKTPQLVNARDHNGMTPLHHAAYGKDADLIRFLAKKGANIESIGSKAKTPLHIAAIYNRREIVAALLRCGALLDARDDYQRTALILCAREQGQADTGRVLIEAGADINALDKFGSNALELAAWRGKSEFVDLLLEKGAVLPATIEQRQSLLSLAASQGLTNLFRRLTQAEPALAEPDKAGVSLLSDAAAGGSAEIVGLLLDKGFKPDRSDRFGWTPLHYAARDGRTEVTRTLIAKGAPLNTRTLMGQTPYNVATERRMEAVAGLLSDKGADKAEIYFPLLQGEYLGQTPPGNKSELFGLGIISSIWGLHSTAVFSPDGNEVYWAPMMTFPGEIYSRVGLLMMQRINDRWTPPSWAPFSGPDSDDDVPFFSPDGKRIYFISQRKLPEEKDGSERIWFTERILSGWSDPKPVDPNVNSISMHWEFSLERNGNIYIGGETPDSRGMSDIYFSRCVGGKYEKPVNLGEPINTPGSETTPFIAPDGSYLLFSRQYDLWISFRKKNNAWSEPVKLGPEVNSPSIELCPIVSADGKYLFFLSQRDGESHAYWVRAEIIERARPKEMK